MADKEDDSNNKISENSTGFEWRVEEEEDEEEIENNDTNQIAENEQQMAKVNEPIGDHPVLTEEDRQLVGIEVALHKLENQVLPQPPGNNEIQINDIMNNGEENFENPNDEEEEVEENMVNAIAARGIFLRNLDNENRMRPQLLPNWLPIRTEETFIVDEDKDEVIVDDYVPTDEYVNVLRFGLKRFKESKALQRLEELSAVDTNEEVSNRVKCDAFNVLGDDVMSDLFSCFTFQGKVVLSLVCPQWREQISEVFANHSLTNQSYVWFSKKYDSMPRFLPIVDCCDSCHHIINEEHCILFPKAQIDTIVDSLLVLTPNLKCLRITRFVMNSSKIIQDLGHLCPQLTHIDFTECSHFTKSVAFELAKQFPNLRHLILANTGIDDHFLAEIVYGMRRLVTLVVNCTRITGECLPKITTTIETLDTRNCIDFRSQAFQTFNANIKHQNLMHLKANTGLDCESFTTICLTLQYLVSLELDNPWNHSDISDIDFSQIKHLSYLQSLKIGKGVQLSKSSFNDILKACKQITSFSVVSQQNTCKISDKEFAQISDYWPHLQRLELIDVSSIGNMTIQSISKLQELYYLNLSSCVNIEDSFVSQFLSSNLSLDSVILDRCEKLSHQTLESVVIKAFKMNDRVLRVSMIRCDLKNVRYLRTTNLPKNLRLTFSSAFARKFCTFDGHRTSYGRFRKIYHFMNDYEC